jgi:hypothetical protein
MAASPPKSAAPGCSGVRRERSDGEAAEQRREGASAPAGGPFGGGGASGSKRAKHECEVIDLLDVCDSDDSAA